MDINIHEKIIKSILLKKTLPNLEESNIIFDKTMLDICVEAKFLPNCKFIVNTKVDLLNAICQIYSEFSVIKDLMELHNLVPNEECLINAYKYGQLKNIQYLVSKGGTVTTACMGAILPKMNKSDVQFYVSNYTKYTESLEKRIKQLENQITNLGHVPESINEKVMLNIDLTENKVTTIEEKYKNCRVPEKYLSLGYIGYSNRRANYEYVKRNLIRRIKKNCWISIDGFIDLPPYLRYMLDMQDVYVDWVDIHRLVCLFYWDD